jgi:serine phosphatase RsbU (regulator of sigma subunit)
MSDSEQGRRTLHEKVWQLSQIIAITKRIHSTLNVDSVLQAFLDVCAAELGATVGVIYLLESNQLTARQWMGADKLTPQDIQKGQSAAQSAVASTEIHSVDLGSGGEHYTLMSHILKDENRDAMGVLQLFHEKRTSYDADEMSFLDEISHFTSLAIKNAIYHEASLSKARLDEEMKMASQIQAKILPRRVPIIEGFEVQGFFLPCYETGGDYYQYFENDGTQYLVLMDVSGKGVGAAMVAHSVHAFLSLQIPHFESLVDLAASLNNFLYSTFAGQKYATGVIISISSDRALKYLSAGHTPILKAGHKGSSRINPTGPPLGLIPETSFEQERLAMESGDLVCVYSDGYSEAFDANENEFGVDRLENALCDLHQLDMPAVVWGMNDTVDIFKGEMPDQDDRTLMLVRRL